MKVIDSTYLLPLARIEIETDLLLAISKKEIAADNLSFKDISISSISIFELQAKAAKLGINPEYVQNAIGAISRAFTIEPYYAPNIVEKSFEIRQKILSDYVDCIIVATAVELESDLITEDSRIVRKRDLLKKKYDLKVTTFRELLKEEG